MVHILIKIIIIVVQEDLVNFVKYVKYMVTQDHVESEALVKNVELRLKRTKLLTVNSFK